VEESIQRNDSFGIRVTRQGKEILQYFTDRKALLLETLDFTGKTNEEMEKFFFRIARKAIPLYDQPLAKIYIVKTPDGMCGIFSCICHLMMDTWAITLFYRDVVAIYMAHLNNTPMPDPIRSFEPVIQKELDYRASDRHKKDLEFWRQEILSYGTAPTFTHINGTHKLDKYRKIIRKPNYPFAINVALRSTASHEVLMVEKEDVDNMCRFCTEQNVPTMQLLFFLGMRTYLAKVNRTNDVSVANVIARRATLEEKLSGGTRPLAIFCRTVMQDDTTFMEALKTVMEKQNTEFRHANTNTVEVIALMHDEFEMKAYEGYCSTYLTFQPLPMNVGYDLKVRSQWYCNGTGAMSVYLTIMDANSTGALRCYYEYLDKSIKPETIRKCHKYMIKVIRAGISNPDISMKELLEIPIS